MFGKNKEEKDNKNESEETKNSPDASEEELKNQPNPEEEGEEGADDEENDEDEDDEEEQEVYQKEVLVKSKTLSAEKIVVVFKKIKPQLGPMREQFNVYLFNAEGECKMVERDAVLFWKERRAMEGMKNDISVFSLDEKVEYDFDEVKDLYEVEEAGLSDSSPQNP